MIRRVFFHKYAFSSRKSRFYFAITTTFTFFLSHATMNLMHEYQSWVNQVRNLPASLRNAQLKEVESILKTTATRQLITCTKKILMFGATFTCFLWSRSRAKNLLSTTNSVSSSSSIFDLDGKFYRLLFFFGSVGYAFDSYQHCCAYRRTRQFLAMLKRDFNVE